MQILSNSTIIGCTLSIIEYVQWLSNFVILKNITISNINLPSIFLGPGGGFHPLYPMLVTHCGGGAGVSGNNATRGDASSNRYSGGMVSSSKPWSSFTPFCISSE